MIAVDDLNHWVGHLERNPQTRTPNIDRLAAMGTTFTSAYCAVPACEPSRVALMGGRRPWTTGCYYNGDSWKRFQKPGEGLSAQFLKAGYRVAGAGKIYHSMGYHPEEWTEYIDASGMTLNGKGVSKYDGYLNRKTFPDLKDDDLLDWHAVDYCIERMMKEDEQPFFLACGLYKPHLPFVAPRKYYDDFPLKKVKLPPHRDDDLDDVPPAGVKMAKPQADHAKMVKNNQWKVAIQSYLATISYTDMNVGRLLDALEKSPHRDNTIVVLWSDHGWSLGEKKHWRKFALWEEPTRTVFIWSAPGVTKAGTKCDRPVDLMSVYPTLCSLASIEKPSHLEGQDITPLLRDPGATWEHPAITTHGRGNHAVRSGSHRYIRYANGDRELYDHRDDPYEWTNLAKNKESAKLIKEFDALLPEKEASESRKKSK
ncbi:iduronate-2-sulfatase [Haloferula helveola]|uniref:Iduronate-2-sulfatase n=2 Tax=Haloferula helveola TaxID=490095 RepID=A0ABM7RCT8_9BACT|nr:iduronate-2-sulfatase [Haloferula helveola]